MRRPVLPLGAPIDKIHDWPSFFEIIRERPAMWLGSKSLFKLESIINGITLAEHFYSVPENKVFGGFDFTAFEAWVEQQFNPKKRSLISFHLARSISESEESAFDLWMNWYDQFNDLPDHHS